MRVLAVAGVAAKDLVAGLPLARLAQFYRLGSKQMLCRPLRALRSETGMVYSQVACSAQSYRRKAVRQHVKAGHKLHHRSENIDRRAFVVAKRRALEVRLRADRNGRYFLSKAVRRRLLRELGCGPEGWRVALAEMAVRPGGEIEFKF